jgi:tellurite methyltransferase
MSEADREKWDARYREGAYAERRHPTALLAEWLPRLTPGRALDVACGAGRNALFLASGGYRVDAVDISRAALERARAEAAERRLEVRWIEADLEPDGAAASPNATANAPATAGTSADLLSGVLPPEARYDLIVWVRYVNAALMPGLIARLGEGGHLLCEQHLATTESDVAGPRNPAFRVRPGALLRSAVGLRVLFYHEGLIEDPDGKPATLARLVACRGAPGAGPAPPVANGQH